jgi:hypothetical protein
LSYGERSRPFNLGGLHTVGRPPAALLQPLNQKVQIVVAGHRMMVAEQDYERLTRFGHAAAAHVKIGTVV